MGEGNWRGGGGGGDGGDGGCGGGSGEVAEEIKKVKNEDCGEEEKKIFDSGEVTEDSADRHCSLQNSKLQWRFYEEFIRAKNMKSPATGDCFGAESLPPVDSFINMFLFS